MLGRRPTATARNFILTWNHAFTRAFVYKSTSPHSRAKCAPTNTDQSRVFCAIVQGSNTLVPILFKLRLFSTFRLIQVSVLDYKR